MCKKKLLDLGKHQGGASRRRTHLDLQVYSKLKSNCPVGWQKDNEKRASDVSKTEGTR